MLPFLPLENYAGNGSAPGIHRGFRHRALAQGVDTRGVMAKEIDERIFRFACRAVDIYGLLTERGGASREVARQYFKAATSIGANTAEAAAGQTKADFLAKIAIARQECRETVFWLRLIRQKALLRQDVVARELDEAVQLAAILTAIIKRGRESERRGAQ